jgi:beta-alanine degradation protein BauB
MKKLALIILLFPFFAQAQDKLPDTIEAGWKGISVCEVLYEDDKIRTGTCTYPPGVGQDRHTHGPYFTYVVSGGTLQVTSERGTSQSTSVTGNSGKSKGVNWHELINVGNTTIKFLFIEQKY